MRYLSGLESILCYDDGVDVAELTRHPEHFLRDLELVRKTGLDWFRYPWRWPYIERRPGSFDWGFTDEAMAEMKRLGIEPVVDPCHHVSIPKWLQDGFLNPEFGHYYERFVLKGAERYENARQFTIFNEPYPTTLFCGHTGSWYPYRTTSEDFVRMVANVARAYCSICRRLAERPGFQSVHMETCEHHKALERGSVDYVQFQNHIRFLVTDLILGRVHDGHAVFWYLTANGMSREEIAWFRKNPGRIDLLGLDYYAHSEIDWRERDGYFEPERPSAAPRGFASIAMDYVRRYGLPVMLGETNIRGTIEDRLGWLKLMHAEAEKLARTPGVDFRGFGWFPLWDSCAWARDLCRTAKTEPDPVGIYTLDESRRLRGESELSDVFRALVRGSMTARDIPAYPFGPPVSEWMRGYRRFMRDWQWIEANTGEQAA